jgi:hypothetical protein
MAELKRWMTVTAPVLSGPAMPSRRARLLSHEETDEMNCRSTMVVNAGSKAICARRECGKVNTHWRTGTRGITRVVNLAAKSDMRRPMQLGQKPRRWQLNGTNRDEPQSLHLARTTP